MTADRPADPVAARAAAIGLVLPPECRAGVAAAWAALEEHRRRVVAP